MPFTTPTVSDFKSQFSRDFPYSVPAWGAIGIPTVDLTTGAVTAIAVAAGGQGYKEAPTITLLDGSGSGIDASAMVEKGQVLSINVTAGGTLYGQNPKVIFTGGNGDESDLKKVRDVDIVDSFGDASYNVGQGLFADQLTYSRGFNYLSAHFLVERMLAAGEGMFSQYNWLRKAKHVGGVGEVFEIPDRVKNDPFLSMITRTRYGMLYYQIIAPMLIGNMMVERRWAYPT